MSYSENKNTGRYVVTVSEVQECIGSSNTSITGFIQSRISSASMTMENYCGWGLKLNTYTGLYDGNGTDKIYTAQAPIISVSSLQYRLTSESEWQDFYIGSATANIMIYNPFGYIKLNNTFFQKGNQNIKIEYTAGYSDCPGDLKDVCIEMVLKKYQEYYVGGSPSLGVKSFSDKDGHSKTYYELTDRHIKILDNYKKPTL